MIPRKMSAAARRALTEPSEGKRLVAYRDCVGVLTIGYGHTSRAGAPRVAPGMKITDAEADAILSRDLALFERGVATAIDGGKTAFVQHEFDALVDLAFNIGLGAFRSSSLLRAYRGGDRAKAAEKFLDWTRAGGRVVPGLVARRKRDRAWFLTGRLPRERPADRAAAEAPARLLHPPDALSARAANLVHLQGVDIMKGYRTIFVGLVLAIGPGALQYLGAIDWSALLGPTGAFFISGAVSILMRYVTTTPVGKPAAEATPK